MDALILGVDPGTTTGLALDLFEGGPPLLVWAAELGWEDATEAVGRRLRSMAEDAAAGGLVALCSVEKFMVNANTSRRGQKPAQDSMGRIGVVRAACEEHGVELVSLAASTAKTMVHDSYLRHAGLYAKGRKHSNDAHRHAVRLAVLRRHMDPGLIVDEFVGRG